MNDKQNSKLQVHNIVNDIKSCCQDINTSDELTRSHLTEIFSNLSSEITLDVLKSLIIDFCIINRKEFHGNNNSNVIKRKKSLQSKLGSEILSKEILNEDYNKIEPLDNISSDSSDDQYDLLNENEIVDEWKQTLHSTGSNSKSSSDNINDISHQDLFMKLIEDVENDNNEYHITRININKNINEIVRQITNPIRSNTSQTIESTFNENILSEIRKYVISFVNHAKIFINKEKLINSVSDVINSFLNAVVDLDNCKVLEDFLTSSLLSSIEINYNNSIENESDSTQSNDDIPAWNLPVSPMDKVFRESVGGLGKSNLNDIMKSYDNNSNNNENGFQSIDFIDNNDIKSNPFDLEDNLITIDDLPIDLERCLSIENTNDYLERISKSSPDRDKTNNDLNDIDNCSDYNNYNEDDDLKDDVIDNELSRGPLLVIGSPNKPNTSIDTNDKFTTEFTKSTNLNNMIAESFRNHIRKYVSNNDDQKDLIDLLQQSNDNYPHLAPIPTTNDIRNIRNNNNKVISSYSNINLSPNNNDINNSKLINKSSKSKTSKERNNKKSEELKYIPKSKDIGIIRKPTKSNVSKQIIDVVIPAIKQSDTTPKRKGKVYSNEIVRQSSNNSNNVISESKRKSSNNNNNAISESKRKSLNDLNKVKSATRLHVRRSSTDNVNQSINSKKKF